jgi:hypothetical protein
MKLTHLWADKSSGVRGTLCSRKYSGLAQQMKLSVPIRRDQARVRLLADA